MSYPILYEVNETSFDTNGIGILSDAISCRCTRSKNALDLVLQYPVTGLHGTELAEDRLLLAKADPAGDPQPFRIYRVIPTLEGTVTVYARHRAYDLMDVPVGPFRAASAALAVSGLKANAVLELPVEVETNMDVAGDFIQQAPQSLWAGLLAAGETYGGHLDFEPHRVTLRGRLGTDRGVTLRYGKNLATLEQDRNCAGVCTGVYPYYLDAKTGQVTQLPERLVLAEGTFPRQRIVTLDLSREFQSAPTADQLRAMAVSKMDTMQIGVPKVGWKISFVQREQSVEYADYPWLERVCMGDTVTVEFPALNVSTTADVSGYVFDSILERYESVTLGDAAPSLAGTITGTKAEIQKQTGTRMQQLMARLTASILGAQGGAVRLLDNDGDGMPDTLFIADDADPAQANKVWRFNYQGWGASKTGYNGPFIMGASFDTGILAEFISAGLLYGMTIQAGSITNEDGSITIDLSSEKKMPVFNTGIRTDGLFIATPEGTPRDLMQLEARPTVVNHQTIGYTARHQINSGSGADVLYSLYESTELVSDDEGNYTQRTTGVTARWHSADNELELELQVTNDGAHVEISTATATAGLYMTPEGTSNLVVDTINGKAV